MTVWKNESFQCHLCENWTHRVAKLKLLQTVVKLQSNLINEPTVTFFSYATKSAKEFFSQKPLNSFLVRLTTKGSFFRSDFFRSLGLFCSMLKNTSHVSKCMWAINKGSSLLHLSAYVQVHECLTIIASNWIDRFLLKQLLLFKVHSIFIPQKSALIPRNFRNFEPFWELRKGLKSFWFSSVRYFTA